MAGRPPTYTDDAYVRINAKGERTLQSASDRRAVIDLMVNNAGRMLIGDINKHFGFDTSSILKALVAAGWIEVEA